MGRRDSFHAVLCLYFCETNRVKLITKCTGLWVFQQLTVPAIKHFGRRVMASVLSIRVGLYVHVLSSQQVHSKVSK